jgi:hypothetical protein
MTGLNASTASHDWREVHRQLSGSAARTTITYAGLVNDGVLLGFQTFSVNGNVTLHRALQL